MYKDSTPSAQGPPGPGPSPSPPPPPQDNLDLTVQAPFPVMTHPLRLAIGRCTSHWNAFLLVSTYVVCERLSVMHELAGVVENFGSKF